MPMKSIDWWEAHTSQSKIEALVVASTVTVLEADAQKSKNNDTRCSRLPPRITALYYAVFSGKEDIREP
jgi:hypothetical protein